MDSDISFSGILCNEVYLVSTETEVGPSSDSGDCVWLRRLEYPCFLESLNWFRITTLGSSDVVTSSIRSWLLYSDGGLQYGSPGTVSNAFSEYSGRRAKLPGTAITWYVPGTDPWAFFSLSSSEVSFEKSGSRSQGMESEVPMRSLQSHVFVAGTNQCQLACGHYALRNVSS